MNSHRVRYALITPDGKMLADQDYISDTDVREKTDDPCEALCFASQAEAIRRAGLIRHLYGVIEVKQVHVPFPHHLRRVK